jgi:uncharacterized membrane protein
MTWSSVLPAFLASVVEFVEALTIVLVVGTTINWRSSLAGAGAAVLALAAIVAVLGPAFLLIPLAVFRLVVGFVLVLFGLKWLKKAILRYAGRKALHDEEAIYEEEAAALRARGEVPRNRLDGFGLVTAFKSVLLEGMEVVVIVLTFGASSGNLLPPAVGALAALVLVVLLGLAIRGPLTKVPENTLKFTVGLMLAAFGTFWGGEGLGIEWAAGDLTIVVLVAVYLAVSLAFVLLLKPSQEVQA